MIQYQDISHLAMEVTDLDQAERFYGKALGYGDPLPRQRRDSAKAAS